MYKVILLCLALWGVSVAAQSQNASSMLIMMPDDLIPQLTVNNRKDMIDFAKLNRQDNVRNRFGGNSRITSLSDNFLEISLSEQSTMQLKILPYKDTIIIGIINTVAAPAYDSRINFYTTNWEDMELSSIWNVPDIDDFAHTEQRKSKNYKEAISLLDTWLMKFSFEKDRNEIVAEHSIKDYLPEEIFSQVKPYLSDTPVRYKWTGKKFKKTEQ